MRHIKPEKSYRPVVGYEGLYVVSARGKVRLVRRKWHKNCLDVAVKTNNNCARVNLTDRKGNRKQVLLKNIVADAWLRPRTPGGRVYFKDPTQPLNCSVSNLKEKGKVRGNQKLSERNVLDIIELRRAANGKRGIVVEIAKLYKVHKSTISDIFYGKNWKRLTYRKKDVK